MSVKKIALCAAMAGLLMGTTVSSPHAAIITPGVIHAAKFCQDVRQKLDKAIKDRDECRDSRPDDNNDYCYGEQAQVDYYLKLIRKYCLPPTSQ